RRSSVSQPIERDVVEHLVAREHRFGISGVVGPVVKFLVDPGSLSCRRILEGIADGLWPRRLLKEIAETLGLKSLERIDGTLLARRQSFGRDRIRKNDRHV